MSAITPMVSESTDKQLAMMQKLILQHQVEQFLYAEAALLDERKYDQWYALMADDIHYWMPIRRTTTAKDIAQEFTKIGDIAFFDDDKELLGMRLKKFNSGSNWSEDPPSRTRHIVNNIRIKKLADDTVSVDCNFHLYRSRMNTDIDNWVGRREDRLRRTEDGFEVFQRHIYIDQTVINSTNFSSLF